MNVGPMEIAVIAVVLAVLFGGGVAVGVIVAVTSVRRRNQVSGGTVDPALTGGEQFPPVPDRNDSSKPVVPTSGQIILPPAGMDIGAISEVAQIEIGRLLADGKLIAAIKEVRDQTGLGLKEAKDFAERWQQQGVRAEVDESTAFGASPYPSGHHGSTPTGPVILPPDSLDTTRIHDIARLEIGTLLAAGQLIAAIKKIRESTGLGLKEAKDFAEQWRDQGERITLDGPG